MKTFSLAVAAPCHQNWDAMTPEQEGRRCAACKKTVVDFSSMTDRQVTKFLSGKKGDFCGRFHADQLNREIMVSSELITWSRPFVPLALSALMLLFEACSLGNKTTEKIGLPAMSPKAESLSKTIESFVPDSSATIPADTIIQEAKEGKVQVITKKNRTVHPAFRPVDTMRIPDMDTLTKPEQTVDTIPRLLLKPRKEAFIMGRISYTHDKATEEWKKREQEDKEQKGKHVSQQL